MVKWVIGNTETKQMFPSYDMYSQHGFARNLLPEELPHVVGLDQNDVDVAISEDGWAGCICDVEPVVLVPHGDTAPSGEAAEYMHG